MRSGPTTNGRLAWEAERHHAHFRSQSSPGRPPPAWTWQTSEIAVRALEHRVCCFENQPKADVAARLDRYKRWCAAQPFGGLSPWAHKHTLEYPVFSLLSR